MWFDSPDDALALLRDSAYRKEIEGDLAQFTEPLATVTLLVESNFRKARPGAAPASIAG